MKESLRLRHIKPRFFHGGNGARKSNLFRALAFIKSLVVAGACPGSTIPVEHFLLDPNSRSQQSKFSMEILIDEIVYEYAVMKCTLASHFKKFSVTCGITGSGG